MTRRGLLAAVALGVAGAPAHAQSASDLVASGVSAYENLELSAAAGLLRRGLAAGADSLGFRDYARALTYLGATEVIRGNSDSSRAAFRQLVRHDPRRRLDPLVFPPEVADVFESVRLTTKVALVDVPGISEFTPGASGFRPWVIVSSFSQVMASIQQPGGTVVRTVYDGPISDSLRLEWDARRPDGTLVPSGRYVLAVQTTGASGAVVRLVRVPLDVVVIPQDTLPHPPGPDPGALLPERLGSGAGLEALIGGIGIGAAVVGLSSSLASGAELTAARFGVGGAVAIVGFVGFLQQRPGKSIPDNVVANEAVRSAWRLRVQAVMEENRLRREQASVTIQSEPVQIIDRDR